MEKDLVTNSNNSISDSGDAPLESSNSIKQYTITKSTIECYKLRHESGMYWADINVDAKGKTGRIQIASDYGSWQYYWGSCGSSFKSFLVSLNIGYVAGKFGEGHWFDIDGTIRLNRELILDYRKRDEVDAETARNMWNELKDLADSQTANEYHIEWYNKKYLPDFFEERPDCVYGIDPQFRSFWENCWPAFCDVLRKEMIEEQNPERSVATGDDSITNAGNKDPKSTNGGEKKEEGR